MTDLETLGLPATATLADLRARWVVLCLARHPDHGGATEGFQGLTQAYKRVKAALRAAPPPPCPACAGRGRLTHVNGVHSIDLACAACRGSGRAL